MSEHTSTPLAVAMALDGRKGYVIAAAAGINPPRLSLMAHGKLEPSQAVKERLALILGKSVGELFPASNEVLAS